jgi:hypothetical protein
MAQSKEKDASKELSKEKVAVTRCCKITETGQQWYKAFIEKKQTAPWDEVTLEVIVAYRSLRYMYYLQKYVSMDQCMQACISLYNSSKKGKSPFFSELLLLHRDSAKVAQIFDSFETLKLIQYPDPDEEVI